MPDSVCYYRATVPQHLLKEQPAAEMVALLLSGGAGRLDADGFHFLVYQVDKRGERHFIEADFRKRRRYLDKLFGALLNRRQVCLMFLDGGCGYLFHGAQSAPEWWLNPRIQPAYGEEHYEDGFDPVVLAEQIPSLVLREELAKRQSEPWRSGRNPAWQQKVRVLARGSRTKTIAGGSSLLPSIEIAIEIVISSSLFSGILDISSWERVSPW